MMDFFRLLLGLPTGASSIADGVDGLHMFVIGLTMAMSLYVFAAAAWFTIRYARRHKGQLTSRLSASKTSETLTVVGVLSVFLIWWVIGFRQFIHMATPPKNTENRLRRGEAVDVEVHLRGRALHQRRADRAGRHADQAGDEFARRHPQLLRPGVPREGRRRARPHHHHVVRRDRGGHLPDLVRGILRREPLADARRGGGALAGRLRDVEEPKRRRQGARRG